MSDEALRDELSDALGGAESIRGDHGSAAGSSAGDCYRHAGRVLLDHPAPLLILGFIVAAAVAAAWGLARIPVAGDLFGFAFGAFIATPLTWGFYGVCLRAVRGEGVDARHIVDVSEHYREAVIAAALTTALVFLGFALLVVPGVFLLCRLAFVPFLILQGRLSAVDAMFESFELTSGHGGKLFVLLLTRFALFVVGLVTFGIGLVPGAVWSDLALATFYHRVVERRPPPGWRGDFT